MLGTDILINKKNEFSIDFNYTDDPRYFNNLSLYNYVSVEDDFVYSRKAFHIHETSNLNLSYQYKIIDEDYLKINRVFISYKNEAEATDFINQALVFEQKNEDKNSLHSFAIDYSNSVSENIKFETGFLWNGRH
ncbi:hypothetical protein [Yeosuana marina]|uniref:hypothetical protein n=1 Tax=Yeosuana marina TaxID=1565536 RepID=UPI0014226110|nr:hypothetical protein [Yeosuana marina]